MNRIPYGTLVGVDSAVRKLWHSRGEEPAPLPDPGEWGPLWTDNSRIDARITGQQLLAQIGHVLTAREHQVLELRLEGLTLREAGAQVGVTGSRIREIEAKALRKLRTWCERTPSLGFARPKGRAAATACA